MRAAAANGARIFAPVEICDVHPKHRGVTVTARNGRSIHCRSLIFATGYELPDGVSGRNHKITSTWAIATVPQPAAPLAGAVHHLGGVRPLPLSAHDAGGTRHLRR